MRTKDKKFLVIGATDHVGSKIAVLLADRGYDVTAPELCALTSSASLTNKNSFHKKA